MRSAPPRTWTRSILAWGILAGVGMLAYLVMSKPTMLGVNLDTYLLAAQTVWDPGELFRVSPPGHPGLTWVYPPLIAIGFLPAVWLQPWLPIELLYMSLLLLSGVLLGGVLIFVIESRIRDLEGVDRALIVGFTTIGLHSAASLYFGNLNPLLVLILGLAVLSMERGQETRAGALLALPAIVKVFPAAFALWLVIHRSWKAVAGALGTVLTAGIASLALFGVSPHRVYVTEALLPRRRFGVFEGGLSPDASYVTLRRPLSILFPDIPQLLGALAVLLLLPLVVVVVRRADPETTTGSMLILHAIVVGVLLVLPSYPVYLLFAVPTLVGLLFLLPTGVGRQLVVAGTAVTTLPINIGLLRELLGSGMIVDHLELILTFSSPQLFGLLLTLCGAAIVAGRSELQHG